MTNQVRFKRNRELEFFPLQRVRKLVPSAKERTRFVQRAISPSAYALG